MSALQRQGCAVSVSEPRWGWVVFKEELSSIENDSSVFFNFS